MPDKARNAAEVLRLIAERLEAGEREEDLGPFVWLIGRAMTKLAKRKP